MIRPGYRLFKKDLNAINTIQYTIDLVLEEAQLKTKGVGCLFSDYVSQDDKNSYVMVYKLDRGEIGMPNRDYYFKTDARTEKVSNAYFSS